MHRAADVYLEMIFRDGIYHADPHPGIFWLPDGSPLAILDFGDVGRVTGQRRRSSRRWLSPSGPATSTPSSTSSLK